MNVVGCQILMKHTKQLCNINHFSGPIETVVKVKSSRVRLNMEEIGRLRNRKLTLISGAANSIGEATINSSDRCHSIQSATKRMKNIRTENICKKKR